MLFGVGYDFGLEGDDIFIVSSVLNKVPIGELQELDYFSIASSRHYLIITLILLFHLTGDSPVLMEWIFFGVWLINGCLCFALLNRFFNFWAALLAALFFLVYAGKYEIVPVLSGGVYQFVIAIFLIILLIATSYPRRWIPKALVITLLYWISIHWYELLVPMAPLLFLFYWLGVKKGFYCRSALGWVCAILPLLLTLFHVYVLSNSGAPIWERSGKKAPWEILDKLPHVFFTNYKSILGSVHWRQISDNWQSIVFIGRAGDYPLFIASSILMGSLLLLIGIAGLWRSSSSDIRSSNDQWSKNCRVALLALSGYILLVGHLVSWPIMINGDFTPPRLTYVASLAIAILFSFAISFGPKVSKLVALIFVGLLTFSEAIALKTILFQYSTTATYDSSIRDQLRRFEFKPNAGDTIFISIPENGLIHNVWRQTPAKFQSGGAQSLLVLDNDFLIYSEEAKGYLLHEMILYRSSLRSKGDLNERDFNAISPLLLPSSHKTHFFFLRDDGQLCAVNKIKIGDGNKNIVDIRDIQLSAFGFIPCTEEMSVQIPPK